jgi:hypothetical protein
MQERSLVVLVVARGFLAVDGAEERAALDGEQWLSPSSVTELAACARVAAGLDHAAIEVQVVEAVLGVGHQRALERAQLGERLSPALSGSYRNTASESLRYSSR